MPRKSTSPYPVKSLSPTDEPSGEALDEGGEPETDTGPKTDRSAPKPPQVPT